MKFRSKQEALDATPDGYEDVALQNLLHSFSKSKLESFRRIFAEMDSRALYKTQLRSLSWEVIYNALTTSVQLNKLSNETDPLE